MSRAGLRGCLALLILFFLALALPVYSQREAIVTQVIGDGYLHGAMLDEGGRPVARVPVTLVVQRASGLDCSTGECDLFNAPVYLPRQATDAQGHFSLHVPRRYLAARGKPSLYIYKLQVELAPGKVKFFYGLNLAAREANTQTFEVKPPFWTG